MKLKNLAGLLLLPFTTQYALPQKTFSYTVNEPISQPRLFAADIISTGDYETHPAFTPGGDTLYFLKCTSDLSTCTICVSYFRDRHWSDPVITPFSGLYMDADPFVSKDGNALYFISNRPLHKGDPVRPDTDIWKVEMTARGWSEPIHLDPPVNSDEDEYYPTLADNGTLYFGSARKGGFGGSDIYRCRSGNGKPGPAENLGEAINTIDNEYEPFIAPDEQFLIFMAARPKSLKNADLYISYNKDGKWSTAQKLPSPVNSDAIEFSPKITRDGKYFFFSSTRSLPPQQFPTPETTTQLQKRLRSPGNGLCDIYQLDAATLFSLDQNSDDKQRLSKLNARFIKNYINNDTIRHNEIIHKDFIYISISGKVVNRNDYMKAWAHGWDPAIDKSFEYIDETIRIFGDMALVRSTCLHTKIGNGVPVQNRFIYTDTYIKENGRWWCVQAQITGMN